MKQKSIAVIVLLISLTLMSSAFNCFSLQSNLVNAQRYSTPTPSPTPNSSPTTTSTLGYTTIGSYTDRTPIGDKDSCRYKAPQSGLLSSISMYIQTANVAVRFGVYSDLNGQPNQLLGQSSLVTTTGNSWTTAPVSAPVVAGQNYWLTIVSNSIVYWNCDFGALAGNGKEATTTLSPSYGDFVSWGTAKYSIYATYSTAPTPTPTLTPIISPTPLPTSTPAPTSVPTPKPTSTPTPAPTATPRPSAAPTPSPMPTSTPKPTSTPSPTPTSSPPPTTNVPPGLTLKFQTGFESATATSTSLKGIGIGSFIATQGSGSAGIWIEDGTQVTPQSGTKALGLQAGGGSYRCEFDLFQSDLSCSNAVFVDEWIFLPNTFSVTNSENGGYYDLFQFDGTYTAGCYPIFSLMLGAQNSDGTFPLMLYGRDYTGAKMGNGGVIQELYNHFALPRGQWFHFQWYNTIGTNGIIQAWINGLQVINVTSINTSTQGTQWCINTDIYFNSDDQSMHKMWIDNVKIYG